MPELNSLPFSDRGSAGPSVVSAHARHVLLPNNYLISAQLKLIETNRICLYLIWFHVGTKHICTQESSVVRMEKSIPACGQPSHSSAHYLYRLVPNALRGRQIINWSKRMHYAAHVPLFAVWAEITAVPGSGQRNCSATADYAHDCD